MCMCTSTFVLVSEIEYQFLLALKDIDFLKHLKYTSTIQLKIANSYTSD
jgi:hypothetical protein